MSYSFSVELKIKQCSLFLTCGVGAPSTGQGMVAFEPRATRVMDGIGLRTKFGAIAEIKVLLEICKKDG